MTGISQRELKGGSQENAHNSRIRISQRELKGAIIFLYASLAILESHKENWKLSHYVSKIKEKHTESHKENWKLNWVDPARSIRRRNLTKRIERASVSSGVVLNVAQESHKENWKLFSIWIYIVGVLILNLTKRIESVIKAFSSHRDQYLGISQRELKVKPNPLRYLNFENGISQRELKGFLFYISNCFIQFVESHKENWKTTSTLLSLPLLVIQNLTKRIESGNAEIALLCLPRSNLTKRIESYKRAESRWGQQIPESHKENWKFYQILHQSIIFFRISQRELKVPSPLNYGRGRK